MWLLSDGWVVSVVNPTHKMYILILAREMDQKKERIEEVR